MYHIKYRCFIVSKTRLLLFLQLYQINEIIMIGSIPINLFMEKDCAILIDSPQRKVNFRPVKFDQKPVPHLELEVISGEESINPSSSVWEHPR
jgi:hypothetical protein